MEVKSMGSLNDEVNKLAELVSSLSIITDGLEAQEVDMKLVQWYTDRFALFAEDECPAAITAYLQKLSSEDCNDITKILIMQAATNY